MTAALSPEVILLAGDITSAWRYYGPRLEKQMAAFPLAGTRPRILPTHQGDIARLRGAAAVLLQRHSRQGETAGPTVKVKKTIRRTNRRSRSTAVASR